MPAAVTEVRVSRRDVKALAVTGRQNGYPMRVIEAVEAVNADQKTVVYEKLKKSLGDLSGRTVALWGLAFKPETDDMREAPSLVVIERLLADGAFVRVYDPVAMPETRRRVGESVVYCKDMYDAAAGADAVALMTEWKQFRMPRWNELRGSCADGRLWTDATYTTGKRSRNADSEYSGIGK